jgi:NAD(P)-dependent dehydrogenase (short-subunit alcohol dehydrogenase family)
MSDGHTHSQSLAGRRIIVTGGARGLGEAFVTAFVASGAKVAFGDVLLDEGRALARRLMEVDFEAHFIPLDLADADSVKAFVNESAYRLGGVDGLVNNAAITDSGGKTASELTQTIWDCVMNVNVRGLWLTSVAAFPHLCASGQGSIVNLASDTALWGAPKLLAYVASKGAVISMTRSMAREFGDHGITVNAIAPGLTEVEATAYVPADRRDLYSRGRALSRAQVPADLTGPVTFLLPDAARFVTGQVLPVNGGFVTN